MTRAGRFESFIAFWTEEQGYKVHWKVLDAKSWVPQHRERIFVVGFREPNDFTFDNLDIPDP